MLFGVMSVAAVLVAAPAWSQDVTVEPRRGGPSVDVGPRHIERDRDRTVGMAPREGCHVIHQRTQLPNGRTIYKTRRECP